MGTPTAILGPDAQRQVREKLGAERKSAEKRPKYNNVSQVVDNYRFDSTRQAERYKVLKALQERGEIVDLRCEPAWRLVVNGELICDYVADFSYREVHDRPQSIGHSAPIVEDVKSKITRTRDYLMKKKLMWAIHRIHVVEVE